MEAEIQCQQLKWMKNQGRKEWMEVEWKECNGRSEVWACCLEVSMEVIIYWPPWTIWTTEWYEVLRVSELKTGRIKLRESIFRIRVGYHSHVPIFGSNTADPKSYEIYRSPSSFVLWEALGPLYGLLQGQCHVTWLPAYSLGPSTALRSGP